MKKIFLYGNGILGGTVQSLLDKNKVKLLGFIIDNQFQSDNVTQGDRLIISPEQLEKYDYDYIVISSIYYDEMKEKLIHSGVHPEKIIGTDVYQSKTYSDFIKSVQVEFDEIFKHSTMNELLIESLYEPVFIGHMNPAQRARRVIINDSDYVRYSTLELMATRILETEIQGEVAELGVYKGDFAAMINKMFPEKKLYLFDTFEGFHNKDISIENEHGYSMNVENQFHDTSVELVLSKMTYPQNCIVKKGYFPETVANIDEVFAFVSIDVDLYQPIYDGLKYFFPRLSIGGAIFIHDYLNNNFKGVKKAVDKFCREENITLQIMSDFYGSAIITK